MKRPVTGPQLRRLGALWLILTLGACAAAPESSPEDEGAPRAGQAAALDSSRVATLSSLTLVEALARVDAGHPQLSLYRAYVALAEADAEQAGLLPNPQLVLRMENAPWSRGSTRNQAEYVAGLSFQLPISGRLGAARDAGNLEVERRWEQLSAQRAELHGRVRGAFASALSLERAAQVQSQARDHADRAVEIFQARVRGGDAIPADLARTQMEALRTRLELSRVESLRAQALAELTAAIGDPAQEVQSLSGELEQVLQLPALAALLAGLDQNPRLRAAEADLALSAARLELAKAERIPDISLDLFYRRLEESDQHAFDFGVGIPLPIFDRNQGGVRSAAAAQEAARARAALSRSDLIREVRGAHLRLKRALGASTILRDQLLPLAEVVLAGVEARFQAGDASLVEALPVRRDWTTLQLEYLGSLREVLVAWSDLETLTAASAPRS